MKFLRLCENAAWMAIALIPVIASEAMQSSISAITAQFAAISPNATRLTRLIAIAVALLILISPQPAHSQAPSGISLVAEAGYDGYFKDNHLIPVRVTVENAGPNLEAHLQIRLTRQNNAAAVYDHPVSLPTTSRKQFSLYVFPESFFIGRDLKISLVSDEQEVASTTARLDSIRPSDRLYGVLAGNPSAFNLLSEVEPDGASAFVAQLSPEDLPDNAAALRALDVLVISNLDIGPVPPGAIEAVHGWVSQGGHLLVTGGSNWQNTAQGLGAMLPLSPNASTSIDDLEPIQTFANSRAALGGSAFLATGSLAPQAQILVGDEDLPVVARSRLGHGYVTYLSMDPSQEPLRSWDGLDGFYRALLQTRSDSPSWIAGVQNFDLAAQAVGTLPNLPAPSAWLFCGFLSLYVAALGPANYFILRRLRRRELAWLSIPGLVIAFSVLAFTIGSQMRGRHPILNRMAVVQAWPEAGHARVDGLAGVFSPRRDTYQVEIDPPFLAHPIPSANAVAGGDWLIQQTGNQVVLPEVRTEVGGMHAVMVKGAIPAPDISHDLEMRLNQQRATLQGSITNRSSLNFGDAVLIAQGKTQRLGEVRAGETRDIRIPNLTASPGTQSGAGRDSTGNPGAPPNFGPPAFNQGVDLLATDVLGTSNFYADKEIYRRYLLFDSLLIGDLTLGGAGDGVYLIGWVDGSPLPVELTGVMSETTDLSLYIIALQPSGPDQ